MEGRRTREGGRGRRAVGPLQQLPWRSVTNPYAPLEMLSADQLEAIHLTSLRILEELGIDLMSARAQPPLDIAVREELDTYVAMRRAAIGSDEP